MSRATLQILRKFSTRLLMHETSENISSETTVPVAFQICEKLHPQIATLMGNGGFRALLTRALALTKAEVSSFRAVRVNADGTLGAMSKSGTQIDPEQLAKGSVVLLAQLLGLLVSFIGANLTLGLVREVWPELHLNNSEFGIGGKDEETK
ncbi:MAG: hypothetical protein ACYC9L_14400 [Sulfuricaulis sp.]